MSEEEPRGKDRQLSGQRDHSGQESLPIRRDHTAEKGQPLSLIDKRHVKADIVRSMIFGQNIGKSVKDRIGTHYPAVFVATIQACSGLLPTALQSFAVSTSCAWQSVMLAWTVFLRRFCISNLLDTTLPCCGGILL